MFFLVFNNFVENSNTASYSEILLQSGPISFQLSSLETEKQKLCPFEGAQKAGFNGSFCPFYGGFP